MDTILEPPRFETGRALLIAGLTSRYSQQTAGAIPELWRRFAPHIGRIPGQVGFTTYGVSSNPDGKGNFDYTAGVEVSSLEGLPAELSSVQVPQGRYAVFAHRGHLSTLKSTIFAIWSKWAPESKLHRFGAPDLERYGPEFDPATGSGVVEIWVPIKPA